MIREREGGAVGTILDSGRLWIAGLRDHREAGGGEESYRERDSWSAKGQSKTWKLRALA